MAVVYKSNTDGSAFIGTLDVSALIGDVCLVDIIDKNFPFDLTSSLWIVPGSYDFNN